MIEETLSAMRDLTLDAGSRLSFSFRHPAYAFRVLVRDLVYADDRFLASLTGTSHREIRALRREPLRSPEFRSHLRRCGRALKDVKSIGASLYANKITVQYAVIRALRPGVVVETGVANGISSAYILLALEKNQKGQLHSIDINDGSHLPPGGETGWMVPDWLHRRWTLHLGDVRALLAPLLARLGDIDVFIHDSLHTYEHMMFEFQTAFPHVRPGGALFADDASWNPAFVQFAISMGVPYSRIVRGVGFLRKPLAGRAVQGSRGPDEAETRSAQSASPG